MDEASFIRVAGSGDWRRACNLLSSEPAALEAAMLACEKAGQQEQVLALLWHAEET